MWPFKKKQPKELPARKYVLAKCDGVVEQVMYDYIIIDGKRHDCKAPLVELGGTVKKGQRIGK